MSVKKLRRLPLAAAALVACVGAQAEYQSPDGNFRMSGFGTLGAVRSSTDDAIFNYPGQGGGATKRESLNPDSKIAVQGTYKFSPAVSATAQVMTKYDAEGQYVPSIEWAFAKWQATPGLAFRAGRMGAPYFMISDFRDVGYANTTVRPNIDVYGQVPVSQFEGADASYQWNLGETTLTATLWGGDSKSDFTGVVNQSPLPNGPVNVDIKHQVGLNLLADAGNGWSFRVGHSQGKLSLASDSGTALASGASNLAAQLAALGAPAAPIVSGLNGVNALVNPNGVNASFTGVGVAYDQDNWVASAEYTKRKTDSYVSDTTGWYGLLGYRVGKFTPYAGLSKVTTNRRSDDPVVYNSQVDQLTGGNLGAIKGGVDAVLNVQKLDQKTSTLGVRWDVISNVAIKAQWDRISKPADANGMFLDPAPMTSSSDFLANQKSINVLTLSVDFVF